LPIVFVRNWILDEDFRCSIPQLVFDDILDKYILDYIYNRKLKEARTDEEAQKTYDEMNHKLPTGYFLGMHLIENENSIIWGDPYMQSPYCQLLRIPKSEKDTLIKNKDRAEAFIANPPNEIKVGIRKIADN
jgi:hypothetical protein